jgi:hypothetical protein
MGFSRDVFESAGMLNYFQDCKNPVGRESVSKEY